MRGVLIDGCPVPPGIAPFFYSPGTGFLPCGESLASGPQTPIMLFSIGFVIYRGPNRLLTPSAVDIASGGEGVLRDLRKVAIYPGQRSSLGKGIFDPGGYWTWSRSFLLR